MCWASCWSLKVGESLFHEWAWIQPAGPLVSELDHLHCSVELCPLQRKHEIGPRLSVAKTSQMVCSVCSVCVCVCTWVMVASVVNINGHRMSIIGTAPPTRICFLAVMWLSCDLPWSQEDVESCCQSREWVPCLYHHQSRGWGCFVQGSHNLSLRGFCLMPIL